MRSSFPSPSRSASVNTCCSAAGGRPERCSWLSCRSTLPRPAAFAADHIRLYSTPSASVRAHTEFSIEPEDAAGAGAGAAVAGAGAGMGGEGMGAAPAGMVAGAGAGAGAGATFAAAACLSSCEIEGGSGWPERTIDTRCIASRCSTTSSSPSPFWSASCHSCHRTSCGKPKEAQSCTAAPVLRPLGWSLPCAHHES